MARPVRHDPVRTLSRGRCFLYVLPCAYEDLLKLGFSRDPLARMQALHTRWYEAFDLDRGLFVETEAVRDARALELELRRALVLYNAPAPLTMRVEAAGVTEWYRGAFAALADAAGALEARGHVVHPARPWLREALLARAELLYAWAEAALPHEAREVPRGSLPVHRVVGDVLDGYTALGIDLEPHLPEAVLGWYRGA